MLLINCVCWLSCYKPSLNTINLNKLAFETSGFWDREKIFPKRNWCQSRKQGIEFTSNVRIRENWTLKPVPGSISSNISPSVLTIYNFQQGATRRHVWSWTWGLEELESMFQYCAVDSISSNISFSALGVMALPGVEIAQHMLNALCLSVLRSEDSPTQQYWTMTSSRIILVSHSSLKSNIIA